jgi:hypothetical protein
MIVEGHSADSPAADLFATPGGGAPARTRASETPRPPLALRAAPESGSAGAAKPVTTPAQNWVLTPFQDSLLIIAAPLLVLGAALVMFRVLGPLEATAYIILAHVVMTVAHHLPTFIRIYGDVELFKRFKRSFILAPTLSLTFSFAVLGYLNYKGYPLEYFFYIYIMLALWDPWHFLRQHYGFMRIYDRQNAAPGRFAARMDLWLCLTWFAYILLASGDWIPGVLEDLQRHAQIGALLAIPAGALPRLTEAMYDVAIAMSVAYLLYLGWCWRRGYFISGAKLALFAITFGVMYVAYTPNSWILSAAPGWTFKVGFAVLGIVHMTQYLAIVWRYNRSLTKREDRARAGVFRSFHARGTWLTAVVYVAVCLAYGSTITTVHEGRWVMSVLLAVGFTSTLMHYYFDGFIWKVRHQQNREHLFWVGAGGSSGDVGSKTGVTGSVSGVSWWNAGRPTASAVVLMRQLLLFGVPAAVLTIGAASVWSRDTVSYVDHMYNAFALDRDGLNTDAQREARLAFAAMEQQLPVARKLAELQPTAAREAALAYLVFNHARYAHLVVPLLDGKEPAAENRARQLAGVEEAIALLEQALNRGGPLSHAGREQLTVEEARRTLAGWRAAVQQIQNRQALTRSSQAGGRST